MSLSEIKKKILRHRVVSFDVFDTLIERSVREPEMIYDLVGNSFFGPHLAKKFRAARIKAEAEARRNASANGEVTLEEIYSFLPASFVRKQELMREEIRFEIKGVRVKPKGEELFDYAVGLQKRVVLTTDMYLNRETIDTLLNKCGICGHSRLYLSNERRCGKRNDLFPILLKEEQVEPSDVLHIGDNLRSDYLAPKRQGIEAVWMPQRFWLLKKLRRIVGL